MTESRVVRVRRPPRESEGPPYRFGSGYVVREGQIVTAAHVLVSPDDANEPESIRIGDPCWIATWDTLSAATSDEEIEWVPAEVEAVDGASDVAVIAADGVGAGLTPSRLGRLEGTGAVNWSAIGFPNAGLTSIGREPENAQGVTDAVTQSFDKRLGLTVTTREAGSGTKESGWAGLSGAAIFVDDCLIGVVTEDPPEWERSLTGVRIVRALEHDGVGSALHGLSVSRVAAPSVAPANDEEVVRVVGNRVSAAVPKWRDRDELREWLRNTLLAGQPLTSIHGRPGIGKSAVVAKVLADFEKPDPSRSPMEDLDGLVYLSTRTGAAVLTPAHLYESVCELAPPSAARDLALKWRHLDVGAFASLWSTLRRRRIVVVLDHLDDLQDEKTLELTDDRLIDALRSAVLAPSSPRIVITSREPLNLPSDLIASLEVRKLAEGLTPADGIALLRSFPDPTGSIGVESDERLAQVVALVEGVPHGLELVASNASNDRACITKLLALNEAPDTILTKLVSRNFENLDDASRHIVGLLAMARAPLPESEVPQILSELVPTSVAAETIGRLIDARTIAFEPRPAPETGTIHLHPLDADFVRAKLIETEKSLQVALDQRLADWYRAARKRPASWRSINDVAPNVREFQHRWRASHDPASQAAALEPLAEAAIQIARKGESPRLLSAVGGITPEVTDPVAVLYLDKCRFAAEFFGGSLKGAQDVARVASDRPTDASTARLAYEMRFWLGVVLRQRGEAAEASVVLRDVLDGDVESVDASTRLLALFELGLAQCYLGEWGGALSIADRLDEHVAGSDETEFLPLPFDVRSLAHLGHQDYPQALSAATTGIALYADTTAEDTIGYLLNVRGLAHLYSHDLAAAVGQFEQGVEIARRYGQARLEGFCAINLAWAALLDADWSNARARSSRAAECLTLVDTKEEVVAAHLFAALGEHRDIASITDALSAAAAGSRANADLYRPSDEWISTLAAQLAG